MEDISKLEKIENLFIQYDFQRLIYKFSFLKNEYNSEALKLALRLNRYDSIASIQQKIWDIFYESFCIKYSYRRKFLLSNKKDSKDNAIKKIGDLDKYLEISQKIKKVLDES